ncbi:MAG: EAL domain-containing protein [Actinomycetota bacterium]|nr:EAL domain-containing protein [Actinomycetota bacterium]
MTARPSSWAWLLLGVLAAFVVSTLPGVRAQPGYSTAWDGVVNNVLYAAAPVLCWHRARRPTRSRSRAWFALAAGLALYAAGNIYWTIAIRPLDPAPFPTLADVGYLAFYPCAFATLLLSIREGRRDVPRSLWLDGLVGGLAAAALAAAALGPVLEATGGSPAQVATTLAYPVADLLLLFFVVVALVVLSGRPRRSLWVLAAGLMVFLVADIVYLFQSAAATYGAGTPLDAVWVLGALVMALAPAPLSRAWSPPGVLTKVPVLAVPVLATVASVLLLVWGHWHGVPALAVGLGAASVFAAVARLVVTYVEVQSLAGSREQARTDELTGLINRRGFYEHAKVMLGPRQTGRVALLVIDLDGFKEVNDSLGHLTGDRLLVKVARRLREALRADAVLARLGGDEFAVLLPEADAGGAVVAGRRLLQRLAEPIGLQDVTLHVEASVGIALFPCHGRGVEDLLRHADRAMYAAKHGQQDIELYTGTGEDLGRARLRTVAELHTALEEGQFTLHYQPQLELDAGGVRTVEALVRWEHPTRGLLYPADFLPLAITAGLMPALAASVLQQAVDQAAQWASRATPLTVAVNLPSALVVDANLPGRIAGLLAAAGLPASALQIEITEDTLMADRQRGREVLSELRQLGAQVSIDDYGTGYSSLAYLRELPVDELKLDRSFIFSMADDARAAAIVASTVALAHSLGLRIVAEGVENATALTELRRYGCDAAQGHHISRPVPAVELDWLLASGGLGLTVPAAGPPSGRAQRVRPGSASG